MISAALEDRRLLHRLHELPEHRFGGLVVVAGIGGDSITWVCDQFESDSALGNHHIWWNALVGSEHPSSSPSLDELGLWDPYAVLDDWLTASPTAAIVRAPAH